MKKLICSLGVVVIAGAAITPALTHNLNSIKNKSNDEPDKNYDKYQTSTDWQSSMLQNEDLINLVREVGGINSGDNLKKISLSLEYLKDKNGKETNQPIGTLLMNSDIKTTAGKPNMISKHIIDNSQSSSSLTVNYDSKSVTTTTTITAGITTDFKDTVQTKAGFDVGFASASVSDTMSFDIGASLTCSNTTSETLTFDKFSTTVAAGKTSQVDYVVMQNEEALDMVLKTHIDVSQSFFLFDDDQKVEFKTLVDNDTINQQFAEYLYGNNSHIGFDKSFLSIDKNYDPKNPKEEDELYNPQSMFVYIPISFQLQGYTTLITQKDNINDDTSR